MFLSRFLQGFTLDGRGEFPLMKLGALYIEQFPSTDIGACLAQAHDVPLFKSPALALGFAAARKELDGIMVIAEHGDYPESDTGQFMYPKRAWFQTILEHCANAGTRTPVFIDKALELSWEDALWMYSEARRLDIPIMAGSSLPVTWRYPEVDIPRDAAVEEIAVLSYGRLDSYGFHALEILQTLAERRIGGETGVRRVRTLSGPNVWDALADGTVDPKLVEQLLNRPEGRPLRRNKPLQEVVRQPFLFLVEYLDGLRASVLTLKDVYPDWTAAWRYRDQGIEAAVFWTQEARPFMHFSHLTQHIESFFRTRRNPWPVERTLLSSGILDALLISKRDGGHWVETPHLHVKYKSDWDWKQPPPPPPNRPIGGP
jgi:hypothetical protein